MRRKDVPGSDFVTSKHILGDLEIDNKRWHDPLREYSRGPCTACGMDITPRDRAVYLHGEIYHARCAL